MLKIKTNFCFETRIGKTFPRAAQITMSHNKLEDDFLFYLREQMSCNRERDFFSRLSFQQFSFFFQNFQEIAVAL